MKKKPDGKGREQACLFSGIDVSQEWFHACILDCNGNTVQPARKYCNNGEGMENMWNDSRSVAGRLGLPVVYSMEATGIYHLDLLSFLNGKQATVFCLNPLVLRGERQERLRKTKTDELDCRIISDFTRKNHMRHQQSKWSVCDVELKERTRVRQRLTERSSGVITQLRRDLDILCPGLSQSMERVDTPASIALLKRFCLHTRLFRATAREIEDAISPFYIVKAKARERALKLGELFGSRRTADGLEDVIVDEVRYLIREMELIRECIEHQEGKIEGEMKNRGSLVMTVPGIGPVAAAVIESEIGNTGRFGSENAVRAFAGLDPQVRDSGKRRSTGLHISKRGSKSLRTALYRCSLPAIKYNPACTDLYNRLVARGKHIRVARIAVAAKLLAQATAVMRRGKPFTVEGKYLSSAAGAAGE
jgi:transposase